MAIITLGPIVADIRGKISGNYFQGSRSGSTLRKKKWGQSYVSPSAIQARTLLKNATQLWRGLIDDSYRKAWQTAAEDWNFTNNVQMRNRAAGYHFFVSCNCNLQRIGLNMITTAVAPVIIPKITFVSFSASAGGSTITLVLAATIPTSYNLVWYMAHQQPAGITKARKNWKLISVFGAGTGTSFALFNGYTNRYRDTLKQGARLFLQFGLINTNQGYKGPMQTVSCIVGA